MGIEFRPHTHAPGLINKKTPSEMTNLMIKPNDIVYVIPKDMGIFNK